jgi:hypothetical protein
MWEDALQQSHRESDRSDAVTSIDDNDSPLTKGVKSIMGNKARKGELADDSFRIFVGEQSIPFLRDIVVLSSSLFASIKGVVGVVKQ